MNETSEEKNDKIKSTKKYNVYIVKNSIKHEEDGYSAIQTAKSQFFDLDSSSIFTPSNDFKSVLNPKEFVDLSGSSEFVKTFVNKNFSFSENVNDTILEHKMPCEDENNVLSDNDTNTTLEYLSNDQSTILNAVTCSLEDFSNVCSSENDKFTNVVQDESTNFIEKFADSVSRKFKIKLNRVQTNKESTHNENPTQDDSFKIKERRYLFYKSIVRRLKDQLPQIDFPIELKGYEFEKEDISILTGPYWLNDKVVNCYMEYLNDYDKKLYVFSSYFYTSLRRGGIEKVKKYTSNINIFTHNLIYFPVHLHNHWIFVCYDVLKKQLEYRDSLLGYCQSVMDNISDFLIFEYKRLFNKDLIVNKKFIEDIRTQSNGSDCGVFVLMYAKNRLKNTNTLIYSNMQKYRNIILFELFINRKILFNVYD
ncbi:ulp1 protease [Vairimorpha ceranae]|uniref:Ulp1 protease n=1 Tax=Vairimorpha ceranae TaxID=40302 RepID=A0A0F9YT84_9MICR|nr:ulp1 protease [Vairimorpha ceranae]KAF5140932.1 hypothetical protein G9O61_00g009220 [Vairimorpha ceranae]KKO75767.1 ulp1 protease [Vairimorpha ceranae]